MSKRLVVVLTWVVVATVSCHSGLEVSDDLSVNAPVDATAMLDLSDGSDLLASPVYDLAWSACVGTALAGTCAESYFEPFVACFAPAGGCALSVSNSFTLTRWCSGAALWSTKHVAPGPNYREYRSGSTVCLTANSYFAAPTTTQYCLPNDATCGSTIGDGGNETRTPTGGALYDTVTGIFICPNGAQVNVGASLGSCAVLNELLAPEASLCEHPSFGTDTPCP